MASSLSNLSHRLIESDAEDPEQHLPDPQQRQSSACRTSLLVIFCATGLACTGSCMSTGSGFVARFSSAISSPSSADELFASVDNPLGGISLWSPDQPGAWEGQPFEARVKFYMPYMPGFVEDIYIHSDPHAGQMRLSYYSGANTFLVNTSGLSYEIVPVGERQACLVTGEVKHLERVVPDLDVFRKHGMHRIISLHDSNGIRSVGYEFLLGTAGPQQSKNSDSLYDDLDKDTDASGPGIYAGQYKFVVNATDGGTPLSLSFTGHNAFFVNAHNDEYKIVYEKFFPREHGIDESLFRPPQGMFCRPFGNPAGPVMRLHSMHNFALAMPGTRGDLHRHHVLKEVSKLCSDPSTCQSRAQLTMRRFRWIQAHNRRGLSYNVGVNHMLGWTPDEQQVLMGRRPLQLATDNDVCKPYSGPGGKWTEDLKKFPSSLNYTEVGLVGPPRDQGTCGSCWAFGAIGMLEGQVAKKNAGSVIRLSEQHLVDCSWRASDLGCDGGLDASGLSWALKQNDGYVATEETYGRYLSQDGFCHYDKSKGILGLKVGDSTVADPAPGAEAVAKGWRMRSCYHVAPPYNQSSEVAIGIAVSHVLETLVTVGPLSVSINAVQEDFYYYASGVYTNTACGGTVADLDHTVLLTGYGFDEKSGEEYWVLRNSWSSFWGEQGFIRVARRGNICGVATQAVFALLHD